MYHNLPLSDSEKTQLKEAIPAITLLIAGADGEIEAKELEWAQKITSIRGYSHPDNLEEYYDEVGKDFQEKLEAFMSNMPDTNEAQIAHFTEKIAALNSVLGKLDNKMAFAYYKSFTSFAEHVAKSAGGFLRFFSVSAEEKKLISLPMLNEVVLIEEEA